MEINKVRGVDDDDDGIIERMMKDKKENQERNGK